jgi:hypothetical protein
MKTWMTLLVSPRTGPHAETLIKQNHLKALKLSLTGSISRFYDGYHAGPPIILPWTLVESVARVGGSLRTIHRIGYGSIAYLYLVYQMGVAREISTKPENILVHSTQPLGTKLTDFRLSS